METSAPLRLHIDTDGGIDDMLALFVASRLPGVEIDAISCVFGNVPVEVAARNVLLLRQLEAQAWPVFLGAAAAQDGSAGSAADFHGADGLGGALDAVPRDIVSALPRAAELPPLNDAALATAGKVTLLALGPATNLPALVAAYSPGRIERIVMMCGAMFDVGNITPYAEFNAWSDPRSVESTLALPVEVTFVALDLTRKIQLPLTVVENWPAMGGAGAASLDLLHRAHRHYVGAHRASEGIEGCIPHDLVACLVAFWQERFHTMSGTAGIECDGPRRGRTVFSQHDGGRHRLATGGRLNWIREGLRSLDFSA